MDYDRKNTANFGGIEESKKVIGDDEVILTATVIKTGTLMKSTRLLSMFGNGDLQYTNPKAGLNALFAKKDSHKTI